MSDTTFRPIDRHDASSSSPDSRPNSAMSCTTDSSENDSHPKPQFPGSHSHGVRSNHDHGVRSNYDHDRTTSCSPSPFARDRMNVLHRRSSSAMKIRELRHVLSHMTEVEGQQNNQEVKVAGSQNACLLVASQQCLVSRLQDLRTELESMDNEVNRVRNDIVNSRRYFSAMMGVPCGPEWHTVRQTDSAYTSPTSFISRSPDASPYSSDNDNLMTTSQRSNRAFKQLQQFSRQRKPKDTYLSRSDSCSSFQSWRSEVEMSSLFPNETSSAQSTPRADYSNRKTSSTIKR